MATESAPTPEPAWKASADKLRALQRLGLALHGAAFGPNRTPPVGLPKRELSKKYGFSDTHSETARRAVRLVSQQGLTREQLSELIMLARAKKRGNVFFVVWTAMVAPPRSRFSIAKQALEEGWSARELQRQILARFGRRRALGRHRQVADNPLGVLGLLDSATTSWLKMTRELGLDEPDASDQRVAEVPKSIARRLREVTGRIHKLHEVIQKELSAKPGKSRRSAAKK